MMCVVSRLLRSLLKTNFVSVCLNSFCKKLTTPIFLIFSRYFAILVLTVWWRFVDMLFLNDQINRLFPLLIKFHLTDQRLKWLLFILFIYAFYLLPQNAILNIQTGLFFLYIVLWYSAIKIYLFFPFLGLQDPITWSG